MNLLENKINRYYKHLDEHRLEHQTFFAELLDLIRNCEEVWGSVQSAPRNSQEMRLIRWCAENEPQIQFRERFMTALPGVTARQIRRQIPQLYEMGFDYLEISRILEIRPKYVYNAVLNYRRGRELV